MDIRNLTDFQVTASIFDKYTSGSFNFDSSHFKNYSDDDNFKLVLITKESVIVDKIFNKSETFTYLKYIQLDEFDLLEEHGDFILHVIDKNLSTLFSLEYKKDILE